MPDYRIHYRQTEYRSALIRGCTSESAARQAWIDGDIDGDHFESTSDDAEVVAVEEVDA